MTKATTMMTFHRENTEEDRTRPIMMMRRPKTGEPLVPPGEYLPLDLES